jgi:hypothetical protein
MPRNFRPVSYFWSFVEKTDSCWLWTGGIDGSGYGRISRNGVRVRAHREAYELVTGKKIGALFACHKCDNKRCVNPAHIFLGTQTDNMQDWTKKGLNKAVENGTLSKKGDEHWKRTPRGKEYNRQFGKRLSRDFADGKIIVLRGEKGRIIGTKRV